MCPPAAAVREQLPMQAWQGDSHRAFARSCVATGSPGGTWEHSPKRRAVSHSSAFCGWTDTSWEHSPVPCSGSLQSAYTQCLQGCWCLQRQGYVPTSDFFSLILENCWTIFGVYANLIGKNCPDSLSFCFFCCCGPLAAIILGLNFSKITGHLFLLIL